MLNNGGERQKGGTGVKRERRSGDACRDASGACRDANGTRRGGGCRRLGWRNRSWLRFAVGVWQLWMRCSFVVRDPNG